MLAKNSEKTQNFSLFNTIFYVLVGFLILLALISIEELFRCFITKNNSIFINNYVKNFIFLIISAFIYWFLMFLNEKNKIECKEWLKCVIIIYVFLVFNVLNFFDFYKIKIIEYIVFGLSGVLFSIFGVSFYYNYLKNDEYKVKAKAIMVVVFSVAISIAITISIEILWYFIDLIASKEPKLLKYVIYDLIFSIVGSVIINIFFYLSLTKSKKFINNCLIYVNNDK